MMYKPSEFWFCCKQLLSSILFQPYVTDSFQRLGSHWKHYLQGVLFRAGVFCEKKWEIMQINPFTDKFVSWRSPGLARGAEFKKQFLSIYNLKPMPYILFYCCDGYLLVRSVAPRIISMLYNSKMISDLHILGSVRFHAFSRILFRNECRGQNTEQ